MPAQLLLILVLLAQQFALPAAIAAGGDRQAAACTMSGCCVAVQTTTCCGDVVESMRCGKSGGACRCAVESDDSTPVPETPRPQNQIEIGPFLATAASAVIDRPTPARVHSRASASVACRTHNETQALLCIWRT